MKRIAIAILMIGMLAPAAWAQCDAKQLKSDLAEASPVAVARVYLKLAECDADAALETAEEAVPRLLSGDEGNQAAVAALSVGAEAPVSKWVDGLEPDQRSATIDYLGRKCKDEPKVAAFFVSAHTKLGETFWKDRWYRGLADEAGHSRGRADLEAVVHRAELAHRRLSDRVELFARVLEAVLALHLLVAGGRRDGGGVDLAAGALVVEAGCLEDAVLLRQSRVVNLFFRGQ